MDKSSTYKFYKKFTKILSQLFRKLKKNCNFDEIQWKKFSKLFILVAKRTRHFKRFWPQKRFFAVFSENTAFFEETADNKIFTTTFVIKKVMLILGTRRLLSLNNRQMYSKTVFHCFLRKYCFFRKKLFKIIFSI